RRLTESWRNRIRARGQEGPGSGRGRDRQRLRQGRGRVCRRRGEDVDVRRAGDRTESLLPACEGPRDGDRPGRGRGPGLHPGGEGRRRHPRLPEALPERPGHREVAVAAEEGGADGIVAINTMKAMAITPELKMPSLANRFGGLSGPAIRPIGVRAVYDICEKVHIPVIGVGGVGSGRDALEYIMAGASAVQVGTAILSRGLGVFDEITKEMASLLEEAGFQSVPEAIGVAHA